MTAIAAFASYSFAISIHIPRVGDDPVPNCHTVNAAISIHIPRVGDDITSA